jgi:hypothetical protein
MRKWGQKLGTARQLRVTRAVLCVGGGQRGSVTCTCSRSKVLCQKQVIVQMGRGPRARGHPMPPWTSSVRVADTGRNPTPGSGAARRPYSALQRSLLVYPVVEDTGTGARVLQNGMDSEIGFPARGCRVNADLASSIKHSKSWAHVAGTPLLQFLQWDGPITAAQRGLVVAAQAHADKLADGTSQSRVAKALRALPRCQQCVSVVLAHTRDGCGDLCASHCSCFVPEATEYADFGGLPDFDDSGAEPADPQAADYAARLTHADDGAMLLGCSAGVLFRILKHARDGINLTRVSGSSPRAPRPSSCVGRVRSANFTSCSCRSPRAARSCSMRQRRVVAAGVVWWEAPLTSPPSQQHLVSGLAVATFVCPLQSTFRRRRTAGWIAFMRARAGAPLPRPAQIGPRVQ